MARFQVYSSGSPPDLLKLVRAFDEAGVRYVLVGGMAMVLHGTTQVTVDSDFAIAVDEANRQAVADALAALDPVPVHLPLGQSVVWDVRSIRGAIVSLRTSAGDVDLLLEAPGIDSFEELDGRALGIDLGGRKVKVASKQDLIKMKRAAGRPKDLAHLSELESHEQ